MSVVVVGVGSNLGAREALIRGAGALLNARGGIEVRGVSEIYETEPLGPPQPRYLNAAFRLETTPDAFNCTAPNGQEAFDGVSADFTFRPVAVVATKVVAGMTVPTRIRVRGRVPACAGASRARPPGSASVSAARGSASPSTRSAP